MSFFSTIKRKLCRGSCRTSIVLLFGNVSENWYIYIHGHSHNDQKSHLKLLLQEFLRMEPISDEILKRLDEEKPLEPKDMFKRCVGICMNQMSAKTGIKKHGEEAVSAELKEFG